LKVDEAGLVTVINKITGLLTPTANADAATKAYVDAAVGAAGTGDATYAKQLDIEQLVAEGNWVETGKTFYGVGGNTYFCKQYVVNAGGSVAVSNINNGQPCRSGKACSSGVCGNPVNLTYSGATHSETDCVTTAGGSVYNTGTTGTICKFSGTNIACPSGWTQASNWQAYQTNNGWGDADGDDCSVGSRYVDMVGSTFFSDHGTIDYEKGSYVQSNYSWSCPGENWYLWTYFDSIQELGPLHYFYTLSTTYNPSSGRIEIGCK